ncbi:MAG TPA: ABC transporter ATP-binding protein [Methylomirabilota bacterium]|jgi:putative ABC transport system ATP-binding protein
MGAALYASNVRLEYAGPRCVLDVPHLSVAAGARVGITGPSGSGKTSLLYVLTGIELPTGGQIQWAGLDIARLDEPGRDRWRRATVGFVFQDFHLLPRMSALDNVLVPATFSHARAPRSLADRARELLARVGLERIAAPVETLSRGEQQRVAVARALVFAPSIVVADEPTASLDAENGALIGDLLLALGAESASTLVVVSHDGRLLERLDTVHSLVDGRLVSPAPKALTAA